MDWLLEVPREVANAVSGTSFHDSPQLKACGLKQRSQRWWPWPSYGGRALGARKERKDHQEGQRQVMTVESRGRLLENVCILLLYILAFPVRNGTTVPNYLSRFPRTRNF